jgi:hypothetical protein
MATPGQGRIERRLAGILAADVAGCTRPMSADEGLPALLLARRRGDRMSMWKCLTVPLFVAVVSDPIQTADRARLLIAGLLCASTI